MKKIRLKGSASFIGAKLKYKEDAQLDKDIEVDLILQGKNPEEFEKKCEELLKQYPPERHMTPDDIKENFGHSPKHLKKIKRIAKPLILGIFGHRCFYIKEIDEFSCRVTLRSTIKKFNKLFGVKLKHYTHSDFPGLKYRAHEEDISIPKKWKDIVTCVIGLDNLPFLKRKHYLTRETPTKEELKSQEDVEPIPKYNPKEFAEKYYNFPADVHGKGQSIGILILQELDSYLSWGGYEEDQLKHYFEEIKVPYPNIKSVNVKDAQNTPGAFCLDMEVYNDIEIIGSIAYEADIYVYFAQNDLTNLKKAIDEMMKQKDLSIISISYNTSECQYSDAIMTEINKLFFKAALMGITVCVSSGDSAFDGVGALSSCQHVLACGGTMFDQPTNNRTEVVWNEKVKLLSEENCKAPDPNKPDEPCKWYKQRGDDCPNRIFLETIHAATCGGESKKIWRPSYQDEIKPKPPPQWKCKDGRMTPDVAGYASLKQGYKIYLYSGYHAGGGTSAAAPLYAALAALINEKLGKRLGFFNPALYNEKAINAGVFNDITKGDNDLHQIGQYYATPGWDLCTGWGSIDGQKLLDYLKDLHKIPKKNL